MVSNGWLVLTCSVSFLTASADDVLEPDSHREGAVDYHVIDRMTNVRLVPPGPAFAEGGVEAIAQLALLFEVDHAGP